MEKIKNKSVKNILEIENVSPAIRQRSSIIPIITSSIKSTLVTARVSAIRSVIHHGDNRPANNNIRLNMSLTATPSILLVTSERKPTRFQKY